MSKAAGWVSSGLMVYGVGAGVYETGRRLADGDVLGALLSAGQSMADMHAASRSCFTAEMLLDCDGGRKRADKIEVGDLLWSRPEGTPDAKAELKPVEEVFVRTSPVLTIRVAGQAIRTTAEHPFWVQGEGWLPAGFLRPGDLLRTRGGLLIAVEAVENNGEVETVYNWRIGEFHTYYVSATVDGVSLWAHNASKQYSFGVEEEGRTNKEMDFRQKLRDNGIDHEAVMKAAEKNSPDEVHQAMGRGKYTRKEADAVFRDARDIVEIKNGYEDHHLMTNKNRKSKHEGGPYTERFEEMAKKAGFIDSDGNGTLQFPENILRLKGHEGPHARYDRLVHEHMSNRLDGLSGKEYRTEFLEGLKYIREQTKTPGTRYNRLATGQPDLPTP